jgi:acetyltransferase-like isoleucine patch superfamily enzyme
VKRFSHRIQTDGIFVFINIPNFIYNKMVSSIITLFLKRKVSLSIPFIIRGYKYMEIGADFSSGAGLWLEAIDRFLDHSFKPKITIGKRVRLSKNVHITAINEITIGDDVLIGSNVYIGDHQHGSYDNFEPSSPDVSPANRKLSSRGSVIIENNVWIGDNVVILSGSHVKFGSIIGANSIVNNTIEERLIAVGSPAKPIKKFENGVWKRAN